jgi:hypothetical protein
MKPAGRDFRLDFWRGLCLVDMVIVHLVYEGVRMGKYLQPILGEYVRFAAGGFIFLAGLGITHIFLPKARDENRRWGVYTSLWRRSLYLLGVHYAASLSFIFIYPIRDFAGPYPTALQYARDVLLFREGSDLLIFYVIMVALSPAFLEIIRRGYWWAAAFFSLSLFAFSQYYPYVLSLPIQKNFMVVSWQMIFVMGMIGGAAIARWDTLALRAKLAVSGCAWLLLAAVEVLYLTPLGYHLGLKFDKCPLAWGEALRYLALISTIILSTDLAWRFIADSGAVAFLTRLGRRSLAVYVAHVWVVAVCVAAARRTEWIGDWQVIYVAVAVGALWGWTCVLDMLSEAPKRRGEEPRLVGPQFWRLSGAAVAGIAVLFSVHASMPLWKHRDPAARMMARMTPPRNLAGEVEWTEVANTDDDYLDAPNVGPLPEADPSDDDDTQA